MMKGMRNKIPIYTKKCLYRYIFSVLYFYFMCIIYEYR